MIVDGARELLAKVDARRATVALLLEQLTDEDGRLEAMRASLEAFLDQPGPEELTAADRAPAEPAGHPSAPVSQPSARGERSGPSVAGTRPADYPDSARTRAPAASPVICPKCGRTFRDGRGRAPHVRACKGSMAAAMERAEGGGKNGHPSHVEKFLCAVCSRPFLSRTARDVHQAEMACAAVPTRPPEGREPLVLPGSTQARGFGQ